MNEAPQHPGLGVGSGESHDSPDQVLAALHDRHQVVSHAEIDKLQLAVQWAIMHPVESLDHGAATVEGTEGELAIAGPGAPLVAEFCVADLALALGMSTDAGRTYLGDAIELRYRLPKLWAAVTSGRVRGVEGEEDRARHQVTVSRRRRATSTPTSPPLRTGARSRRSSAPSRTPCAGSTRPRPRSGAARPPTPGTSTSTLDQVSFDGTVHVDADLDLADALDLNDAVTAGAAPAGRPGVRRSPSTCAAPWPPAPWPAATSPSTSTTDRADRPTSDRPAGAAQAGADDLRPPRRRMPGRRGREHPVRDLGRAGQGLVRRHRHPRHHPAGDRPQRRPAHRRLPAHRGRCASRRS